MIADHGYPYLNTAMAEMLECGLPANYVRFRAVLREAPAVSSVPI